MVIFLFCHFADWHPLYLNPSSNPDYKEWAGETKPFFLLRLLNKNDFGSSVLLAKNRFFLKTVNGRLA
jgi:hypothetical protein